MAKKKRKSPKRARRRSRKSEAPVKRRRRRSNPKRRARRHGRRRRHNPAMHPLLTAGLGGLVGTVVGIGGKWGLEQTGLDPMTRGAILAGTGVAAGIGLGMLSPAFGAGTFAGLGAVGGSVLLQDTLPAPKLPAKTLRGIDGPEDDADWQASMPAMSAVVANDMGQIAQMAEMLRLEGMAAVLANDMGAMFVDDALSELYRVG